MAKTPLAPPYRASASEPEQEADTTSSRSIGSTLRRGRAAFWRWYESHSTLHLTVTALLFALQLIHLYWLTADVVMTRLIGQSFLPLGGPFQALVVLVDYTELPALLSTTFIYAIDLRRRFSWRPLLYLLFLNSQWLHIFWITDEFVVNSTEGNSTALPVWLAWVAIAIDYLELPVMVDISHRAIKALLRRNRS